MLIHYRIRREVSCNALFDRSKIFEIKAARKAAFFLFVKEIICFLMRQVAILLKK